MPIERRTISRSQFSELLGFEPARFLGVSSQRARGPITVYLEPEAQMTQTSGTFPQLTTGKKKGGKKGKRGC